MNKIVILFLVLICKAEAQSSALQLADSLYIYGEYSNAIQVYKPFEDTTEVSVKIAKSYLAIGNIDLALQYYKRVVTKNPENLLHTYDYGKLLSRAQKLEAAETVFKQLIKANNRNPNYYYELGLVQQKVKDSTHIDHFLKALDLDPNHIKTIYKLGRHALKKRDYLGAIKMADKGLAIYKNSKELISLKAQAYYWQEDYFHATEWFLKRLELGESTQFIYEKLSYCYSRNYDHKKAINYLEKALKFDPQNATNIYLIGKQYALLEDFKKAESYFKRALKMMDTPLDKEYSSLGSALNRQKKYKEAFEAYNHALRHNPKSAFIPFFVAHTKAQYYKDIDAKIKVYEDFVKKYPNNKLKNMAEYELEKLKKEKFMEADKED